MSFLEDLGTGLRGAGGILSPQVYQEQNRERQNSIANLANALKVTREVRAEQADARFREAVQGIRPGMSSSALLEKVQGLDPSILADSPSAQGYLGTISALHQKETMEQLRVLQLQAQLDRARRPTEHFDSISGKLIRSYPDGRTETLQVEKPREAGEEKIPSGYRRSNSGNLEYIPGGPADPDKKTGSLGNRESVFISRVMLSANEAAKDLENVVRLPITSSRGFFGGRQQGESLFSAGRETLTNKMTSQEVQSYNVRSAGFQRALAAIEAAGLAPSGTLSHQMDAVLFKEGDTNLTKLEKLAQTRQIVEAGLETTLSNPKLAQAQRDHIEKVITSIKKSVPFTIEDIDRLNSAQQQNPKATLQSIINKMGSTTDLKSKVEESGWSYEPDKYDYRIEGGKVQRKSKEPSSPEGGVRG